MDPILTLILIVFFLLMEGFFSGGEFTLISVNRHKLRHLAENEDENASIIEKLMETPDRIFGATSVGTNLCVFSAASIATFFMVGVYGERAELYSFLIMGPLTLVMGEIVPKMLARNNLLGSVPYIAKPLRFFQRVFTPVLWLTSIFSRILLAPFFRRHNIPSAIVSRDEILRLTKISEENFDLAHDEKKMINKIFEFKKTTVEETMQPLVRLAAVSTGATLGEAKALLVETGYSRLPVFKDRVFNIVGMVSAFEILRVKDDKKTVDSIMGPAFYTPLTKRNAVLLKEMRENDTHMATAVDEYGAAVGLVTVEDLVEEIIGEIEDEFDNPVKQFDISEDGKFIIDSMMEIDSVNEALGLDLPKGDYETVGGFVTDILERIPAKKEKVAIGHHLITILEADERRVKSVEIEDLRKDIEPKEAGDIHKK